MTDDTATPSPALPARGSRGYQVALLIAGALLVGLGIAIFVLARRLHDERALHAREAERQAFRCDAAKSSALYAVLDAVNRDRNWQRSNPGIPRPHGAIAWPVYVYVEVC